MTKIRIQSHADLKRQLLAVARGEEPAPADAGCLSFDSVEATKWQPTPADWKVLATQWDRNR